MGPGDAPYVTTSELSRYFPQAVLDLFTTDQKDQACLDATQEADSYLRGRYQLPLLDWGDDVRRYTAAIALYLLSQQLGFAPQGGSDKLIVERYYAAVGWPDRVGTGWFPGIQRQAIHPDVTPTLASPGNATFDLPQVRTAQQRGWSQTNCRGKPVV